jgi:hypothetical protein
MSGAGLSGVANALFPLPPLPPYAIIASQSPSVKSAIIAPVSKSDTTVPSGTFIIMSSAFLPN